MRSRHDITKLQQLLIFGAALLPFSAWAADGGIFEINVTNDPTISSGEPEIAVDPKNPRNLAIVEFGVGSDKRPAYSYNPLEPDALTKDLEGATANTGRVMLSKDGGNHWSPHAPPAYDPNASPHPGGGDPFIAYGPDGTLYVGGETGPAPKAGAPIDFSTTNIFVAPSRDGGKTFGPAQSAATPEDRPWITVDQTTGTVYTASTGTIDANTKVHNVPPGPDVTSDRWLVTWQPHLAGKSAPRRIGGPDFSGAGGSTITAAHGVVAATFVVGSPGPGGAAGGPPAPVPMPASLQPLIKDGTTSCSLQAPCLFFETSTDQGQHWTRHHIPVAGGFSGQRANVAADPGKPGRYAIAVLNPTHMNFLVLVTDDSGSTWTGPVTIPETAVGADFKQWMTYGPTGALGLVWKKRRDDLTPPPVPGQPPQGRAMESAFDVYAAISCDGGATWPLPLRVNGEPSPAGAPGFDDLAYITLDANDAHLVWGDRRILPKVTNVPGGFGGVQAYYGRVPLSLVSKGVKCGRG